MRWFLAIVTFVFTGSVAATDMSVDQAMSRLLKDIKDVEVMRVPVPATPQLRDHQKIHHRKADQAGQEPLLHDTAHQPTRIQPADHQLSNPKDRHLHGKGSEGETPFRCTEMKHSRQSARRSHNRSLCLRRQ